MIIVYTDGSGVNNKKNKNHGKGGYGVYIKKGEKEFFLSKGYKNTTSNRMEIRAVLYALKAIKNKSEKVLIYSDSMYVINSIMLGWIHKWESYNWETCKNPDLWKRVVQELKLFDQSRGSVVLKHIKGHQDNLDDPHVFGNNVADALADFSQFNSYKNDIK
jgi:ribonuclease HI